MVIRADGIGTESERLTTLQNWATVKSIPDSQILLALMTFYQKIVRTQPTVTTLI